MYLRTALAPLADRIDTAFIYGSIARGEERKSSDIDVLIVGNVTFADVTSVLSSAQKPLVAKSILPSIHAPSFYLRYARDIIFLVLFLMERSFFDRRQR